MCLDPAVPCRSESDYRSIRKLNFRSLLKLEPSDRTMRDTRRDVLSKYKKTFNGGLVVNDIECYRRSANLKNMPRSAAKRRSMIRQTVGVGSDRIGGL